MPQGFIAHICFLGLVVSVAVQAQQQPKADSDVAISQTLQATERAWLNAEKNHDVAAFEKIVADDWIAISPDGKSETKPAATPERPARFLRRGEYQLAANPARRGGWGRRER